MKTSPNTARVIEERRQRSAFVASITLILFTVLACLVSAQDEWVRQSPLPTARNLTGVSWATSSHALASGDALTLIETLDSGTTWSNVDFGTSTNPFYNVLCRDAANCFVIGNSDSSSADNYRTTDSGATWQPIIGVPAGSWYHIDFVSPTVGFMGSNGATARTTDGGATWGLMSGSL